MKWLQRLQVLEISQETPGEALTKLSKAPSVSFVSADSQGLKDIGVHIPRVESKPDSVNPTPEPHEGEGSDNGDSKPPASWIVGAAMLEGEAPLPGFRPDRWATLIDDARGFLDRWAGQAAPRARSLGRRSRAPRRS